MIRLSALEEAGYLSSLDFHLARTLTDLVNEDDPLVGLGLAVASRATSRGHVCADLGRLAGSPVVTSEGEPVEDLVWPEAAPWIAALKRSLLVTEEGDDGLSPLVLDGEGRLYLARYYDHQERLAVALTARSAGEGPVIGDEALRRDLEKLFPGSGPEDAQRIAAETAVRRRFTVISGGPGTGKTTVVVKILALLAMQAEVLEIERPRIFLAAPTGKAAARLGESVKEALERKGRGALDLEDRIREIIPGEAVTLHKLIGIRPDRPGAVRHDEARPLGADVVVVDEASMVDLALMTRLVRAVPPAARLILLGDRNQLASVEAGAVLADLCRAADPAGDDGDGYGAAPLAGSVVNLTRSYRFGASSGVGIVASAINEGDGATVAKGLRDGAWEDVTWVPWYGKGDLLRRIRDRVLEGYGPLFSSDGDHERIEALERFRILCAHRRGRAGVESVNPLLEGLFAREGLIHPARHGYEARPVIVLQNDALLNVRNGDVGIYAQDPDDSGRYRVALPGEDGAPRYLSATRLPDHETVFAMTVHKSQGSEFDEVLVILPERVSPLMTRELLYTAVTRARRRLVICGDPAVIKSAASVRVTRASGLADRLRRS